MGSLLQKSIRFTGNTKHALPLNKQFSLEFTGYLVYILRCIAAIIRASLYADSYAAIRHNPR